MWPGTRSRSRAPLRASTGRATPWSTPPSTLGRTIWVSAYCIGSLLVAAEPEVGLRQDRGEGDPYRVQERAGLARAVDQGERAGDLRAGRAGGLDGADQAAPGGDDVLDQH